MLYKVIFKESSNNKQEIAIKSYKENLHTRKSLIELAFEWKLSTKKENWKYWLQTNWEKSIVPVKYKNWKIWYTILNENIDDILYINSLNSKDRRFIKHDIYKKILEWKKISKGSVWIHFVEPRFKKLIQNPKFYDFYKRMIILAKQNFFITNIEKFWDAVEWDEENSWILHPINNFKRKILKILDK